MTQLISFIIVLGILITVHELGHFLIAKAIGLGVERFSIGFPPKMFGFTKGETEYCVSWIPLGGYVKLKGEHPDEMDEDPDDPKHFMSRPPYQRAAVVIAGPLMNLVLAFLLMPLVFLMGIDMPVYLEESAVVGWIEPGSAADRAGIVRGNRIIAINDMEVATWQDLSEKVPPPGKIGVTVKDSGRVRSVTLDTSDGESGILGVYPQMDPVIGSLESGHPAGEAGIKEGDRIEYLGGVPVSHWMEMARIIHASPGKSITFGIDRNGEKVNITVIPELDERTGYGLIGINPEVDTVKHRFGAAEALRKGTEKNLEVLGMTFDFLWDLITFNSTIKNIGGPIMIFQVTGQAAKEGLVTFIQFMAFLSLQLGVLNLLPIPVLDGGHLVFLTAEGIKRKPVNLKTREAAQKLGFFLLLLLILIISYNDIVRLITSK
jgi:regulator of sigma E protease